MKKVNFPTDADSIHVRLSSIDPIKYTQTRNYLNGSVSYLSPYITHGFLTLSQIRKSILDNHSKKDCEKILQELAWREYFQRVYEKLGDQIWKDVRHGQINLKTGTGIPRMFVDKHTEIKAIDVAIQNLEENGYMHNHARMWTAMLGTNIYKFYWKDLSKWMYYHLLDGDIASNTLSWQWVAGTFSAKVYIANQDNINKYDSENNQRESYLNTEYENLENLDLSDKFKESVSIGDILTPNYPDKFLDLEDLKIFLKENKNIFLYHMWNLSPENNLNNDKINLLIIEKSHLDKYPISKKRIDFIQDLALNNINNLKIIFLDFTDFINLLDENHKITTTKHQNIIHFKEIYENKFIDLKGTEDTFDLIELPYLLPNRPWKSGGFMSWYNSK